MPTLFFADLVRELAHEGGTGPLTPTGAAPGHRRFAEAVPPGVSFHYAVAGIAHADQWEVGTGRIGSDGRLLRESIAASSNGGAAVDFAAGLKTIALTVGADWFAASDTQTAALAGEVTAFAGELTSLTGALDAKQPLSTTHGSADAGEATDMATVRRGAGWVNIPLSALVFRGGDGRYALDGALDVRRPDSGDIVDIGQEGGQRLRMFADGDMIGLFNVANAGAGRDGLRIVDGAVAFDIAANEIARFDASGVKLNIGQLLAPDGTAASPGLAFGDDADTGFFNPATNHVGIAAFGKQVARFAANGGDGGSLAVGAHNPDAFSNWGVIHANGASGAQLSLTRTDGGARAQIFMSNGGLVLETVTDHGIIFGTSDVARWIVGIDGRFYPNADNTTPIGFTANRISDIYLGNSPTVTSDLREKTWRGAPTAAELRAARRIVGELGFFQWNAAIAAKGALAARLHFGARAQAVWSIMADEGLIDPIADGGTPDSRYAFLCFDRWDGAGAGEDRFAADRFGIRPDQLALFLVAAQEARLSALEAAA